jgi:nitrogen fixation protein NifZ
MGLGREQTIEVYGPPQFLPGALVRATKYVKNDGTFAGREIGEILVKKGSLGYVRDIGTFLQIHYVYSVEFFELGIVVGMRARELECADQLEKCNESHGS